MSFGNKNFTYGPRIVKDGLIFYLDAANTKSYISGDTITNDLILGITGTLENGVGFLTENNGVWYFDGSDDYIDLGTSSDLKPANISISAWFYPIAVGTKGAIIANSYRGSGWHPYYIAHWTNDKVQLNIVTDTNNQVYSTGTLTYNQWVNIAVTYDGSNGKIYFDGVLDSTHSFTGNIDYSGLAIDGGIIGKRPGFEQYIRGNIANEQIYNRGLSAAEILQNYNALKGRFGL